LSRQELHSSAILDILLTISGAMIMIMIIQLLFPKHNVSYALRTAKIYEKIRNVF
jgi:hypothetical protein